MENSYGIGVTNRYNLFLDESADPLEILKLQEREKELKRKSKLAEKENKNKEPKPKAEPKPKVEANIKVEGKSQPANKQKDTPNAKDVKPRADNVKATDSSKPERGERGNRRQDNANPRNSAPTSTYGENVPPRRDYGENGPPRRAYGENGPPRRDYGENGPARREYGENARREYGENAPSRREYGDNGPPRREYGDNGPPRREYGDNGPPRREYGENDPPRRDYGDRERGDRRRGGGGPRTGGRGQPGGARGGYEGRGKREFDRQSGSDKTSVKKVDKRDGGGAYGWGTIKDDIEDVKEAGQTTNEDQQVKEVVDEAAVATSTDKPEDNANPEPEAPAVEDAPKELTLDEWKAQRAERQKPQYNLRKAGEGEDSSQWKTMYALSKKHEGAGETDEEMEYDPADYPQRVGRQKHILDIAFEFTDSRRSGGAGGRGRGRRGGGRPRGDRPQDPRADNVDPINEERPIEDYARRGPRPKPPPKVNDEHDFPSLG